MSTAVQAEVSAVEGNALQLVLDSEGRIVLPQPIRELLGVAPGATLSYILANGVLMLFPNGVDTLSLVARAMKPPEVTDQWKDNTAEIEAELVEIRARVVREMYGDEFMDKLEREYGHLVGTALTTRDDSAGRE
jgi:bifunctional DNA-binding transcriptional regulator/antitoxin component of YhaV-PrlF toxin-antitoxin module